MERRLDYGQMAEFIQAVHRDDDGHIAIAARTVYGKFRQRHYHGVEALLDACQETYSTKTDLYVSINSFYLPLRKSEALRRINALYVDIDIDNRYYGTHEEMIERIRVCLYEGNPSIPAPSLMIDSGGGCHLYWLLEDLPRMALAFWQAVAGHLASDVRKATSMIDHLKVDAGVSADSQRVMRLPGTYNQRNGRMCRIVVNHGCDIYRLDELRDRYGYGKIAPTKKFFPTNGNSYYARVLNDLVRLRDLRAKAPKDDWCRKRMTFLFRHFALLAGINAEKALELTQEYNGGFAQPIPETKLTRQTESAQKAIEQGKAYRYKIVTLIDLLSITKTEMKHMTVLVDDITRQERRRARRRAQYSRRGVDGLTDKQREMDAARLIIDRLVAQGKTQSEIAAETGYSLSKVKRIRAEHKKCAGSIQRPRISQRQKNRAVVGGSEWGSYYVCDLTPSSRSQGESRSKVGSPQESPGDRLLQLSYLPP